MTKPSLRWTKDTERAFLLALRQTGQVARAAAAIGRQPAVCYKRRERSPAFAAEWERTLCELEAARHADGLAAAAPPGVALTPSLVRTRTDGWTQVRQRRFLRALADTGRYAEAAARVGLSAESVRLFRQRSPEFQALCDKALVEGGTTLEEAAYMRATEGWEEAVFRDGKLVGYRRRFSDTLAKTLLERDRPKARAGRNVHVKQIPTDDEVLAALDAKLTAMETQIRREEKAKQAAWAERMEREGWAP